VDLNRPLDLLMGFSPPLMSSGENQTRSFSLKMINQDPNVMPFGPKSANPMKNRQIPCTPFSFSFHQLTNHYIEIPGEAPNFANFARSPGPPAGFTQTRQETWAFLPKT
jgi:hypothetical protein